MESLSLGVTGSPFSIAFPESITFPYMTHTSITFAIGLPAVVASLAIGTGVELTALRPGTRVDLTAWSMKSIWKSPAH